MLVDDIFLDLMYRACFSARFPMEDTAIVRSSMLQLAPGGWYAADLESVFQINTLRGNKNGCREGRIEAFVKRFLKSDLRIGLPSFSRSFPAMLVSVVVSRLGGAKAASVRMAFVQSWWLFSLFP